MEIMRSKAFEKKDTLLMKGVAILLMLFYHLFESAELLERLQVDYRPFSQEVFLMLSGYGNMCVAIFVFLSAYGIVKGLMRDSEGEILYRQMYAKACHRCLKLIGNFLVMYLSVNLLWFSYFDYTKLYGKGWQGLLCALFDMFGLAQLLGTPTLNMTWWYMELAIIIIFLVPLLYVLVKKFGNYLILLGLLLCFTVNLNADVQRYIIVILFGVVAAAENWFEKWSARDYKIGYSIVIGAILILFSIIIRQNFMIKSYFQWLVDAPIAVLLCWYGKEILARVPGVSHALGFLGKHSMNIFFVHTFFYMAIYQPYIYSVRLAGLIFLLLLAVTLLYSVILEAVKTGGRLLYHKLNFGKGAGKKSED